MATALQELPHFQAESRAQWRDWLKKYHKTGTGVWLVTYKKSSGGPHLPYAEAVEEALCFGWIDSKPGIVDAERTKLMYTPRKPNSVWSKVNKERLERLIASGKMTDAGLEKIEIARQNGSWDALNKSDALEEHPELSKALKSNKLARKHFYAFPASIRKQLLQWIYSAKTDATRDKRIAETVEKAAQNIRANQWTPKS
jgi:uncharacterized protein YdeI (YjbR/CyaY-like superfamily)